MRIAAVLAAAIRNPGARWGVFPCRAPFVCRGGLRPTFWRIRAGRGCIARSFGAQGRRANWSKRAGATELFRPVPSCGSGRRRNSGPLSSGSSGPMRRRFGILVSGLGRMSSSRTRTFRSRGRGMLRRGGGRPYFLGQNGGFCFFFRTFECKKCLLRQKKR